MLCSPFSQTSMAWAEETSEEVTVIKEEGFEVDDYHANHQIKANFIPENILYPNGSVYQAPMDIDKYEGLYVAETEIPVMDTKLNIILSIEEDGLFNLAYYFTNKEDQRGIRFYVNDKDELVETSAVYQDLVMLTGGLLESEGGLTSGLIQKTISPVVLLDTEGKSDAFYPYKSLAFELRESYQNARVYQNVGLYIVNDEVVVDVKHLIGLKEGEEIKIGLKRVEDSDSDQFLVEQRTYQVLQDSFDEYLDNYNDFILEFDSLNDFVQIIQAMHLKTNASFPKETTFELVNPDQINKESHGDNSYALLINNELLYFYDGAKLFISQGFSKTDEGYKVTKWKTN